MTCELCGESLPLRDVLDHIRLMHPDQWDEQMSPSTIEVHIEGSAIDEAGLTDIIRRTQAWRRGGL